MEMVRKKNKDGVDGCAEHKETMGDGIPISEIKTTVIIEVPRAPRIQDLRGVDMQWWKKDIARYRADQKGYAYAKIINNYYAELKGVGDEI